MADCRATVKRKLQRRQIGRMASQNWEKYTDHVAGPRVMMITHCKGFVLMIWLWKVNYQTQAGTRDHTWPPVDHARDGLSIIGVTQHLQLWCITLYCTSFMTWEKKKKYSECLHPWSPCIANRLCMFPDQTHNLAPQQTSNERPHTQASISRHFSFFDRLLNLAMGSERRLQSRKARAMAMENWSLPRKGNVPCETLLKSWRSFRFSHRFFGRLGRF